MNLSRKIIQNSDCKIGYFTFALKEWISFCFFWTFAGAFFWFRNVWSFDGVDPTFDFRTKVFKVEKTEVKLYFEDFQ
jgi:hypothetical protein